MPPSPPAAGPPQVLIADDQPAVLDALRLLLKEEGYRVVTAARPVEILKAVETNALDAVVMDLNYARDTTSGKRRARRPRARARARRDAADHRHDRVRQRARRRRSHASWRGRLRREAVGRRASRGDPPHADRAVPGASRRTSASRRRIGASRLTCHRSSPARARCSRCSS